MTVHYGRPETFKLGLIARADDRGLGTMTQEFHRQLDPHKTLVVLTGDKQFPEDVGRFPNGKRYIVQLGPNMQLPESTVRDFLRDLDVVYSAETFYDWRMIRWAREMNVKTVLHAMPELTRHHHTRELFDLHPDEWWWPTEWLVDHLVSKGLPRGRQMIVPTVNLATRSIAGGPHADGPLRVVHPGGKEALGDRDGTQIFIEAMRHVTSDVHATIYAQDREFPELPDNVTWTVGGYVKNRWDMFRHQHVTVLPRRYGGLSLKVHESLGSGVPVLMSDVEPNRMWPGQRVKASRGRRLRVPCGMIQAWDADPVLIAEQIDDMNRFRDLLHVDQKQAEEWARANSWVWMRGKYVKAFEEVIGA